MKNVRGPTKAEMVAFLKCFDPKVDRLGHGRLPSATPAQSAARQECSRRGYASFANGEWEITEFGRLWLENSN